MNSMNEITRVKAENMRHKTLQASARGGWEQQRGVRLRGPLSAEQPASGHLLGGFQPIPAFVFILPLHIPSFPPHLILYPRLSNGIYNLLEGLILKLFEKELFMINSALISQKFSSCCLIFGRVFWCIILSGQLFSICHLKIQFYTFFHFPLLIAVSAQSNHCFIVCKLFLLTERLLIYILCFSVLQVLG